MQGQLFATGLQIVNVIKQEPTDILDPKDLFFIQELIKKGFKDDDILIKFELQERQPVLDYIQRLRRVK